MKKLVISRMLILTGILIGCGIKEIPQESKLINDVTHASGEQRTNFIESVESPDGEYKIDYYMGQFQVQVFVIRNKNGQITSCSAR